MSSNSTEVRKVAIVTGSANGIGKAIALRLAKDGFNVVISDLEFQSGLGKEVVHQCSQIDQKGEFLWIPCDVTQEAQVQKLVDDTVDRFKRLDCMVANAGIAFLGSLSEITVEQYNKGMTVNATGTLLCYRTAAKAMIECNTAEGGRIIGACSLAGKKGVPLMGIYSTSKFAIRGLTQTAAMEYGSFGITVNAYAPGFVSTPLVDTLREQGHASISGADFIRQSVEASALKRVGRVEEVADLVSFLASDQSSFITGQCISIDGGNNFD